MIIGMAMLVVPGAIAQEFQGPVGEDLIDIHVGRGAGPALDQRHDQVRAQVMAIGDEILGGRSNRISDRRF